MTRDGTAMVLPGVVAQGDRSEDPVTASRTPRTGTTKRNLSEILSKGLTTAADLGWDELTDGLAEGRTPADGVELHALPAPGASSSTRIGWVAVRRAPQSRQKVSAWRAAVTSARYRSPLGCVLRPGGRGRTGRRRARRRLGEAPDPSGVDHSLSDALHPPVHLTGIHTVERWRLDRAGDPVDDSSRPIPAPATPPRPGRRGCRRYRPGDSSKAVWCRRGLCRRIHRFRRQPAAAVRAASRPHVIGVVEARVEQAGLIGHGWYVRTSAAGESVHPHADTRASRSRQRLPRSPPARLTLPRQRFADVGVAIRVRT